jgi:hypothetical protein
VNERYIFVIAALVAEFCASVIFYAVSPLNPLLSAFPDLISYAGQHAPTALILWLVVLSGAWIYAGPQLTRTRQNMSTKLKFLTSLGLVGVFIDGFVSLYQFESSSETMTRSVSDVAIAAALAERAAIYVVSFSAVALISFLIGRNRKPVITPPPRFGRE